MSAKGSSIASKLGLSAVVQKARHLKAFLEEERKLTRLFYKSLEANYLQIKESRKQYKNSTEKHLFEGTLKRIEDILKDRANMSWENANFVEQLLIPLYDDVTLNVELNRRLVEAEENLSPRTVAFYREKSTGADSFTTRALLKNIVKDIQWENQKQELKRFYSTLARRNTGIVFIGSVIAFALTVLVLAHLVQRFSPDSNIAAIEAAGIAMAAGLMGSSFSMLTSLKERLSKATFDELKVQRRFGGVITRVIVGLGAALILIYFIQAGLLEGTLFPEFKFADGKMQPLDIPNLSLLIVWSVIAGFSEKFVPNIISQTESKAQTEAAKERVPKPVTENVHAVG